MNGVFSGVEVAQRRVLGAGVAVDERRVPLGERAAPRVLPGQPHRRARRATSEPNANSSAVAQSTSPELAIATRRSICGFNLGWTVNPSGGLAYASAIRLMTSSGTAVVRCCDGVSCSMSGSGTALPVALRVSTNTFSSCVWKSLSAASASSRVMSPRPTSASVYSFRTLRLRVDDVVHQRLGERRVVRLVVPASAVADHVDDDVLLELAPELDRELRHPNARLRVVAVHVEDRRRDHARDVGAVQRRARRGRRGREADLVVHDHVDGAAGAVPAQLREVQRLGHHALAGEGGVAVHQQRQHGEPGLALVEHVLLGPHDALEHRVDRLQVRRVRGQRHRDLLAVGRAERALGAEVVLHVAGALRGARVDVALELVEDLGVRLADDVGEHVEPAAVRHADDDLVQLLVARPRRAPRRAAR